MLLQLQTWMEVEEYLKTRHDVILPIGSTEQHGPAGVLGTDALCAEIIGRGLGERVGALVAPTIAIGMAQHHLGFPGSMSLRPSTLMTVIKECVESLANSGFRRFFFINGHGENIPTIKAAFSEIYAERSYRAGGSAAPEIECKLSSWWTTPQVRQLISELYGGAEGSHAMPSEISLVQFAHREAVRHTPPLTPERAPRKQAYTDAADYRRKFPDGRMGSNSALASPAHGQRFYDGAIADLAKSYRAWLAAVD